MAGQEDIQIGQRVIIPIGWTRELIVPIKFPHLDLIVKAAGRRKPAVIREGDGVYFAAVGLDVQQFLSSVVPNEQIPLRVAGDDETAIRGTVNRRELAGRLPDRSLAGIPGQVPDPDFTAKIRSDEFSLVPGKRHGLDGVCMAGEPAISRNPSRSDLPNEDRVRSTSIPGISQG